MKRLNSLIMALVLTFVTFSMACSSPSPSATPAAPEVKPIKAVLSNAYPAGMSSELALHKLAALAKEKTKGRLIIEVHSGGELYTREDEIMALSTGAIQMVATNSAGMVSVFKGTIATLLPYIFSDYKMLRSYEATPEWQAAWKEGVEKKLGIKTVGYNPVGPGMMANKIRPINKFEDLKGLKMRSANAIDTGFFKALGVEAVQIPITEYWTALEQGMIEGFTTTYAKFVTGPEADYGKFAGKDYTSIVEGWVFVNTVWWDSLPADVRQIMETEVLPEVERYSIAEMDKVVNNCVADTTKRGVTWTSMQDIPEMKIKLATYYKALKMAIGNDVLYDRAMEIGSAK
jgi:TRAP-type C4-dicarboxylate transport system substrate-binding protein